jgi:general secretion pathway protein K
MTELNKQQGIALMMVLLILAIASVASVSMSTARQLDIRRTKNLLRSGQAWEYVDGLESWAAAVLIEDGQDNKTDSLDDKWNKPLPKTPIPGGNLLAGIDDLQGRFNLNNLLKEGKPSQLDIQRFQRLLVFLSIKPELSAAILDWMDSDAEIRYPSGAEDESYLRHHPPYRSANRLFSDVSELLLIAGVTLEIYQKLSPNIYAADQYEPININTATPLMIRCLADNVKEDALDTLIRARKNNAFATVEDFIKHSVAAKLGLAKDGISVTSNQFLLVGKIQLDKLELAFESQLARTDDQVTVVKRTRKGIRNG